jgi:hypothetical protein
MKRSDMMRCIIHRRDYFYWCLECHPGKEWSPVRWPWRRYRFARSEGYSVWDSLRYAVDAECTM